jgi:hypothetical protein
MSKSFKYVKDFEFPSDCGYTGSAGRISVKGYMRGGSASCGYADGGKARVKDVIRNERQELKAPTGGSGMLRNRGALGVMANKNPGETPMHTAPNLPGMRMKTGGAVPKKGAYKVGKVMGEFGKGELHSGSKKGPVVKNPKQAIAIALSEARSAAKKK